MPNDSRREVTRFTREQLVKKSRWLYNNMGLVRRFVKGIARYTVGSGICPIPVTGDVKFDEFLETYFDNWADYPQLVDVREKQDFWSMTSKVLQGMFKDGDDFVLKAPTADEVLSTGFELVGLPRLQWIEQQQVGNLNGSLYDRDQEGFQEGVLCDQYGAALKYRVLEDISPDNYDLKKGRIIERSNMLHIFDVERASQVRGLPWLYHGVNSALDIVDLLALEKHATKLHAAMAAAIKKRTADAGKKGFTGDLTKQRGVNADGKKRVVAFENFMGGAGILQLALDEEFQLLTSGRPNLTFTGFIDYLIRDMAAGFGVSADFIWATADTGGTNVRMILEDAKWFFEELQDFMIRSFCRPVYMWVIARGIQRGEIVVPAGLNPYATLWQGPAKVTVDQGKEGNLELERLKNGCGTWEEYWNARGKSGRKQVRRRIDEIAEAMKYAEEKKVPFDYVFALNKGGDGGPSEEKDPAKGLKTPPKKKAA